MYLNDGIKEDHEHNHTSVTIQAVYGDYKMWVRKTFGWTKMPEMNKIKFQLEELYGTYPRGGWKHLIFKRIGAIDDVDENEEENDEVDENEEENDEVVKVSKGELTEAMKVRFTFTIGYDTTCKELQNYHEQCCNGVDYFKLIDFIMSKGAKENNKLTRDQKRSKRGFINVGICGLF